MADARSELAALLRDFCPGHPAVRIWGRMEGHRADDEVIADNAWAGSPEDVADAVLKRLDELGWKPPQ